MTKNLTRSDCQRTKNKNSYAVLILDLSLSQFKNQRLQGLAQLTVNFLIVNWT